MDDFKELFDEVFEIISIDENHYKKIEISPDKTIYFIFHENQKIIMGNVTSASIEPVGFILKMGGQYYYCALNEEKLNEKIFREFIERFQPE